jgi:hypothetical protein
MSLSDNTPEELQQALDAVTAHGNVAAAARVLGIARKTLEHRYKKAVAKTLEPKCQALIVGDQAAAGPGQMLKGTTTLYGRNDETGQMEARLQWVKHDKDMARLIEIQRAALAAMCKEIEPLKAIKAPKHALESDLLTLITITDSHVGMLAWDKETGEDWDLIIAERCLTQTFCAMIDAAPTSAIGIINQLGDFLHFDSLVPLTPTSKHVLDADSRYQKVVEVAVRILRRIISHALTKFPKVQVYMHEGNHDPAGSVWLRVMFAQLFENNPSVSIGMSPNPYTIYEHGVNFLGFHHGHLSKKEKLPLLFAAKFAAEWGRTTHRVIHCGHLHNVHEQEHAGITVFQHATIAAPDAYAARNGYISKRQAVSCTYHKDRGEIARGIFAV